ncbi:MAG: hypothetical protein COB15_01260 [Flavobacteriales bacterium]|nr:MAG: hypothetical protein COB15_01260 [Flavobacteriales bacterium]
MKNSIKLIILLFISQTIAAQNYSFEELPNWVKTNEIPKEPSISKYDVMSGYYLTLADYQVLLEENAFFYREVSNVISYSGITNASQLAITYDTSYQHLNIHHLYIWRKGKKIDRTKDLSMEIMNNEYNLHQGIYTGKITAYDNLDDIRKDDLIDLAYTLVGKNPIFGEDKYLFIPLEAMNHIDLYTIRVLYPKEKEYSFNCVDCDSTIQITDTVVNGSRQIEITNTNLKPLKLEDNIPTWVSPYKYFTLSSYSSWKNVNKWAQDVFTLPNKQELSEVFDEIFTGEETTEEKINKIINYTQDDIRYMGIESGIGSIKPFTPTQVVKQRFGDCKDKSLLLVTLLKDIGVEKAYPTLVNTLIKHELDEYYPSNEIFNHCIVKFEYDSNTYWIDPTITLQGGDFKRIYAPDYGKVLVVGQPNDSLESMSSNSNGSATYIEEEYIMTSFSEPTKLKIKSKRTGFEADSRRALLEYYPINDLSKSVTEDLKLYFLEVTKKGDIEITDDIEKNIFTVTYNYEIDGFWQDGDKSSNIAHRGYWLYKFEPQSLYSYLKSTVCEEREFDFELLYPMDFNYRVILNLPKDLLISDDFKQIENEAFYYEEKFEQLDKNSLQIDYKFKMKSTNIKAGEYLDICKQVNEISKKLPLVIYFPK